MGVGLPKWDNFQEFVEKLQKTKCPKIKGYSEENP